MSDGVLPVAPRFVEANAKLEPAVLPKSEPARSISTNIASFITANWIVIVVILLLILVAGSITYMFYSPSDPSKVKKKSGDPGSDTPAPAAAPPAAALDAPAPSSPSSQELDQLINLATPKPADKPQQNTVLDLMGDEGIMGDAADSIINEIKQEEEQEMDAHAPPVTSSQLCNSLTQTGRPCRNYAKTNGKCSIHS